MGPLFGEWGSESLVVYRVGAKGLGNTLYNGLGWMYKGRGPLTGEWRFELILSG